MPIEKNKYALASLKDTRARLAGEISALKSQLEWKSEQLAHVDATIAIYEPNYDVQTIPKKRTNKRIKLFRQGELGRLIRDALRNKPPQGTHQIVSAILEAQGHSEDAHKALYPRVRANLNYLEGRGAVIRNGRGKDVVWSLKLER